MMVFNLLAMASNLIAMPIGMAADLLAIVLFFPEYLVFPSHHGKRWVLISQPTNLWVQGSEGIYIYIVMYLWSIVLFKSQDPFVVYCGLFVVYWSICNTVSSSVALATLESSGGISAEQQYLSASHRPRHASPTTWAVNVRNKCPPSNKCLTSSNKKPLELT